MAASISELRTFCVRGSATAWSVYAGQGIYLCITWTAEYPSSTLPSSWFQLLSVSPPSEAPIEFLGDLPKAFQDDPPFPPQLCGAGDRLLDLNLSITRQEVQGLMRNFVPPRFRLQ